MNKLYLDYLDLSKGIGIILVIMGHTLFPLHQAIDIFHMPLFFFLSGLTFKITDGGGIFLIKKINRIFVPYCFFSIISAIIEHSVDYQGPIFNGPLWFLQTIFVSLIILYVVYKKMYHYRHIVMVIFFLCSYFICNYEVGVLPFSLERAIRACFFIMMGFEISKFNLIEMKKRTIAIGFVIGMILYTFFLGYSLLHYNVSGLFVNGDIQKYNYLLFNITAIGGIMSIVTFSVLVKEMPILNWFGKNSLVILCVHFPLAEWLNVQIAQSSLYIEGGLLQKLLLGVVSYTIIIIFSSILIYICKNFIPQLTGYKNIVSY